MAEYKYLDAAGVATLWGEIKNLDTAMGQRVDEVDGRLDKVETFFAVQEDETLDSALDTLKEIQAYITSEGSVAGNLMNAVAANTAAIATKVDQETFRYTICSVQDQIIAVDNKTRTLATREEVSQMSQFARDYTTSQINIVQYQISSLAQRVEENNTFYMTSFRDLYTQVWALQDTAHSHTNKDVLDSITSDKITIWDGANAYTDSKFAEIQALTEDEILAIISPPQEENKE